MNEDRIREIVKDEIRKNSQSGDPVIPRHIHDGSDNIQINPVDLLGFSPIPVAPQLFLNPSDRGLVSSAVINAAGTGYLVGDVVGISGGADNNAALRIMTIGGGGSVTGINIQRGGTGYIKASNVATTGGTGTGLTVDIVASSFEYGFGSPITLMPASSTNGAQIVDNNNTSQYPIPVVVGNGRISGQPQGNFQGGASPDGTLVAFINGVTADLYLRYDGFWYGVNLNDKI